MKSNLFKYIFIIFVIGIMIFAFIKINQEKSEEEIDVTNKDVTQEKITELHLGIAEFDTLNPILTKNKNVQDITKIIYEPLINITSDYKAEACLATEWAKQNETTYIIKLKENVKWGTGEKFTSQDVEFTINKIKETNSIYLSNVSSIAEIVIVDDYTIQLNLDKEIPFFEYNLTFPILSKIEYDEKDFNDSSIVPTGTGMYKVSEIEGTTITLNKNQNWWNRDKELSLTKILVNVYSSAGELYNAFKIGNIDMVCSSNTNLSSYIGEIGYTSKEMKGREHTFLALNTSNYFLANQEVRKAIAYSIDKSNIVSDILSSKYYTSSFPLDYGNWSYQEQDSSSGYNTEQAKQLLVDGGWTYSYSYWNKVENYVTQRMVLNLVVKASDTTKVQVAENIKSQLEVQGIRINIQQYTDEQYNEALQNKNYDMVLCTVNLSISPDLSTFFGDNNLANYYNEEVTNIMNEVKNTTDENNIIENYKRLGEIYKTDIPYISLYTNKYTVAHNTSLVGNILSNWYNPLLGLETWYK